MPKDRMCATQVVVSDEDWADINRRTIARAIVNNEVLIETVSEVNGIDLVLSAVPLSPDSEGVRLHSCKDCAAEIALPRYSGNYDLSVTCTDCLRGREQTHV